MKIENDSHTFPWPLLDSMETTTNCKSRIQKGIAILEPISTKSSKGQSFETKVTRSEIATVER